MNLGVGGVVMVIMSEYYKLYIDTFLFSENLDIYPEFSFPFFVNKSQFVMFGLGP